MQRITEKESKIAAELIMLEKYLLLFPGQPCAVLTGGLLPGVAFEQDGSRIPSTALSQLDQYVLSSLGIRKQTILVGVMNLLSFFKFEILHMEFMLGVGLGTSEFLPSSTH